MARSGYGVAFRQVRMLLEVGAVGGLTDRELLERFRTRGGEIAELSFTALVDRHGPMVLRICQRGLRDEHDAEDAFQATFLVLARKARSLRVNDSLGPWLHTVACRVAAYIRDTEARRRTHERQAAQTATPTARGEDWDDLGQVLHEEIERLPERYRAAVVLCDLEGLTQEQAAQRLGWPSGTVRSRLARGRGRLQARLIRRGLAPSAGALAALLTADSASAAVPAALAEAALCTATQVTAGHAVAATVPAAALTEGVLRAMFMTKLKLITTVLLAIGTGASGTAVIAYHQAPGQSGSRTAQQQGAGESEVPADVPPGRAEAEALAQAQARYDALAVEAEVTLAELELKRAEDRIDWSNRMFEKGYVSKAQNSADQIAVVRARFTLEKARMKQEMVRMMQKVREKPEADKTIEERKNDKISLLKARLQATRAELQAEEARLEQASSLENNKRLLRDKSPGALSEAEWKLAEAESASAAADCNLRQAEVRLLELRLNEAKQ